eukprot:scaffold1918_cov154-Amphora_coffeaeformis.AAC.16
MLMGQPKAQIGPDKGARREVRRGARKTYTGSSFRRECCDSLCSIGIVRTPSYFAVCLEESVFDQLGLQIEEAGEEKSMPTPPSAAHIKYYATIITPPAKKSLHHAHKTPPTELEVMDPFDFCHAEDNFGAMPWAVLIVMRACRPDS